MRSFTIYALQDPRPKYRDDPRFTLWGVPGVRYVGQTFKDVRHRLSSHLLEESNPYKSKWRAALAKDGLSPAIVPIHSGIATQEEADQLEIALIEEARQRLGNKLINLTGGGQGGYYSDDQMHESRTRRLSGPDGYERPGNTPYECLIDAACPAVRTQMLVRTNRDIREIGYRAERESLRQLSSIQVGTEKYRRAYRAGFNGEALPAGRLVEEAGYIHGKLARAGYAKILD